MKRVEMSLKDILRRDLEFTNPLTALVSGLSGREKSDAHPQYVAKPLTPFHHMLLMVIPDLCVLSIPVLAQLVVQVLVRSYV